MSQSGSDGLKQFIRYLYGYEQGKRTRNVGFVKVEQGEDECAVHIHGKGLRLDAGRNLSVYLFYVEDEECVGIPWSEAKNVNPAVNERLCYGAEDEKIGGHFGDIRGVIMQTGNGRCYAAVWDDTQVDVTRMRMERSERTEHTVVTKQNAC